MLTRIDKLIIIIILAAALISLPIVMSGASQARATSVSVYRSGKKIDSYPLNQDKIIKVKNGAGGYCLLKIEKGKAFIIKSTCPLKICIKTGRISDTGQSIICAPMKLMFRLESANKNYLDAVNE